MPNATPPATLTQMIEHAHKWGVGQLSILFDPTVHLTAIVALHSPHQGPAIGGCRCVSYDTVNAAMQDALRLAQMMAYKSALLKLPHAGGKAVLLPPPGGFKSETHRNEYFESFGKQLNQLQGRYITAVDSGTRPRDMDSIAKQTPFVLCQTQQGGEDTAHHTAWGVLQGIKAAVRHRLSRDNLAGCRVAIQGVGSVGMQLVSLLLSEGASLFIADTQAVSLTACKEKHPNQDITIVPTDTIHTLPCDVFAPCALSGTLTPDRVAQLHAPIVAGAANAQLADEEVGPLLFKKEILYAPDFVINAGGLIFAASHYGKWTEKDRQARLSTIYARLLDIFKKSDDTGTPTHTVAHEMAISYLQP